LVEVSGKGSRWKEHRHWFLLVLVKLVQKLRAKEHIYHVVRRYKEVKGEEFQGSEESQMLK